MREKGLEKKPFGQNLFRQLRQKTHESQRKRGERRRAFRIERRPCADDRLAIRVFCVSAVVYQRHSIAFSGSLRTSARETSQ